MESSAKVADEKNVRVYMISEIVFFVWYSPIIRSIVVSIHEFAKNVTKAACASNEIRSYIHLSVTELHLSTITFLKMRVQLNTCGYISPQLRQ